VDKGDVFCGLRNYSKALESYNKSIELNQSNKESWYKKGLTLQALGHDSGSQEAYEKARGLGLNDIEAMMYNSEAYYVSGKYNESLADLEKAIELDPKSPEAWLGKGFSLRALHRDSDADAAMAKALVGV
jgi:tetratricopeptide (TPR) repeat protein